MKFGLTTEAQATVSELSFEIIAHSDSAITITTDESALRVVGTPNNLAGSNTFCQGGNQQCTISSLMDTVPISGKITFDEPLVIEPGQVTSLELYVSLTADFGPSDIVETRFLRTNDLTFYPEESVFLFK